MTRRAFTALVVASLAVVAAAGPGSPAVPPAPRVPASAVRMLSLPSPGHAGRTRCDLCHTPEGWSEVSFPHEKTGFALRGVHQRTACKACHPGGFAEPVSSACTGCHRDAHEGSFGSQCASCHEETGWQTSFSVDAHRRTNFPLAGGHAAIPCAECHLDSRDRSFTRGVVSCGTCHQGDFQRTAVGQVRHQAMGFSTDCQECHDGVSFARGNFPAHERCFELAAGHHAGIRCEGCHTSLASTPATGACATNTASCTGCHTHDCSRSDSRHKDVPGYQCKDRKCYECHRFTAR